MTTKHANALFTGVRSSKLLLGGASALAIFCGSTSVWAQTTDAVAEAADSAGASSAADSSTIVVTGSRLRTTDGTQTPTPVTAVGAAELHAMSSGSLIDGVSQLPQFFGNQSVTAVQKAGEGGTGWFTRGGYGNLDLRGMGANRTLTLLDGHRVISSGPFGGVDINVFPDAMIASVETVTGGASAAYGTDAVAGVVNFKLDRHFTGLVGKFQAGVSDSGDAGNYQGSLTFGTKIGDRGHFVISGEYFKQNGVHSYAGRDWYQGWGVVNGAAYPNVVSANSSYNGVIFAPGTALQGMEFLPNGSGITPFIRSSISSGTTGTPPAVQSITNGGSGTDYTKGLYTLSPEAERNSIFASADYEVADGVKIYAQYIRGQNKTFRYNDPTGSFNGTPTGLTIYQDNAFLPDAVRQTMVANNIQSFTLRRMGSPADIASRIWLRDDNVMNSLSGGLTWNIDSSGLFDGWRMDLYYQYGTNTRKGYQSGVRVDRIFAAVDAVRDPSSGNIVCRTSLYGNAFPGCQPINLFGQGNVSQGALDYITTFTPGQTITTPIFYADTGYARGDTMTYTSGLVKTNITRMRQHIAEFSMDGEVFQGWAGPVTAAFGGSFRRDSILQLVQDPSNPASDSVSGHPVLCSGQAPGLRGVSVADCLNTVGVQYSKVSNIKGAINVKEAFAEVQVPLLGDGGLFNRANLDLAGRWANYTGSGSVWAYKAGVKTMVGNALLLRGTLSRDVRAANLSERFDKTGGSAVLDDPRTTGIEAITVTTYSGGNPDVLPEKADTWTVGGVLKPEFLPGFSLSADYYDIKVKGAIGQLGPQAVLNGCLIDHVATLCNLVTLDTNSMPILVGNLYINVNQNRVRGLDVEANYVASPRILGGDETLGLRGFATWLFENTETLGTGVTRNRAGQTGIQQSNGAPYALPKFKLTGNVTYRNGGFTSFLQGRYIGPGKMENSLGDVPLNHVASAFYLDWRLSYAIKPDNGPDFEIFGMVTNLTDKAPPVTPYFSTFSAHPLQVNSTLFDQIGRRYTVGVKVKM